MVMWFVPFSDLNNYWWTTLCRCHETAIYFGGLFQRVSFSSIFILMIGQIICNSDVCCVFGMLCLLLRKMHISACHQVNACNWWLRIIEGTQRNAYISELHNLFSKKNCIIYFVNRFCCFHVVLINQTNSKEMIWSFIYQVSSHVRICIFNLSEAHKFMCVLILTVTYFSPTQFS